MKNALLTIVTKQPGTDEDLTFTTHTECEETDSGIKLCYEETLGEDDPTVNTRLTIGDDSIMVERSGETGSDMFFKKTTTYETQYRIIGGFSMDMKIFTTSLDINRSDDGLNASVDYQLFIGGSSVGSLGMNITVQYI